MPKYYCNSLGIYANSLQDLFEELLTLLKDSHLQEFDVGSALATREDRRSMAGISIDWTIHEKEAYHQVILRADGECREYLVSKEEVPTDQELLEPYEEEKQRWLLANVINGGS